MTLDNSVSDSVWNSVRSSVSKSVDNSVDNSVRKSVYRSVYNSVDKFMKSYDTCKEETNNECSLESLAKNIWSQVYPERRKWNELEQSTKDEWIRFTKVAKKVISRQQ
jgi:hypothetical protein